MNLAALIVSVAAVVASAWSINYQRVLYRWTRDRCAGPMPKPWHVRYRKPRATT